MNIPMPEPLRKAQDIITRVRELRHEAKAVRSQLLGIRLPELEAGMSDVEKGSDWNYILHHGVAEAISGLDRIIAALQPVWDATSEEMADAAERLKRDLRAMGQEKPHERRQSD